MQNAKRQGKVTGKGRSGYHVKGRPTEKRGNICQMGQRWNLSKKAKKEKRWRRNYNFGRVKGEEG